MQPIITEWAANDAYQVMKNCHAISVFPAAYTIFDKTFKPPLKCPILVFGIDRPSHDVG